MTKFLLTITCFVFVQTFCFAQTATISGKVIFKSDRQTVIGASVYIKGTTLGTTTDVDGNFSLTSSSANDSIVFSFIGYKTQTILRGDKNRIDIELEEDNKLFDEIVVIGYGTQKKSDITGSVSSLRGADLTAIPSLSPEQALQGKIAGVQVNSVSGAPGATPVVRIRGVGTLNNSAPIYVVDGVILDDISFLNSNDIESMEILKDASATAIYGSRGANGVVIVSTKRATIGGTSEPIINVSSEFSVQHLRKKIELLNASQFASVANQISPGTLSGTLGATDWQDEIFDQFRPIYTFHASVTGASERNNYYFGLGYFSQDGIIAKSDYKRLSLKLNDSYKIKNNIKVGVNYTISPDYKNNDAGVVAMAYRAWPTSVPYNADGNYAEVFGAGNPLAAIEFNNSYTNRLRAVGNIFADFTILKDFVFRSSFGQDYSHVKNKSFTPAFFVSPTQSNDLSSLNVSMVDYFTWLWENTLSYNKNFGKHHVEGLAGYTSQKYTTETVGGGIRDLVGNDPALWYLQSGNTTYLTGTNKGEITTLVSSLFRANYSYDSRYLFTASVRRDGSSKFGKNNRYGVFPSFAAGWNLHNEAFLADQKIFSRLKLRASWGIIGNEKIPWSRQYSLVNNGQNAVLNETLVAGATYGISGNPDIRWEETTQTDVGLEIGLLRDKISIEFDYYHKVTDGILVDLLTPGHLGNGPFATVTYNAARVLNSGFELNLVYNGQLGANSSFKIFGNASTIKNEVLSLGAQNGEKGFISSGSLGNGQLVSRTIVGQSVGAFFGYQTDGIFQNEGELSSSATLSGQKVGDLRFKDQNGDGVIDSKDRVYLGSYIPKFVFGFGASFNVKQFDFTMDFNGQTGNKIYNGKNANRPDLYNFESPVANAWQGEGSSNEIPKPAASGVNYEVSDYFLESGSYLRLRSVGVGYTFNQKWMQRAKIKSTRVYVRATNLLTLSGYSGYTPEIASQDALSSGIDLGVYPLTAIYSFGFNFNF